MLAVLMVGSVLVAGLFSLAIEVWQEHRQQVRLVTLVTARRRSARV